MMLLEEGWKEKFIRIGRMNDFWREAKIGKRFHGCTLEKFDPEGNEKALEIVTDYIKNIQENKKNGRGLFIYGPPGSGKTHLAIALLREIYVERGSRVLFLPASELLHYITVIHPAENSEEDFLEALKSLSFLLIDDIGRGEWTEKISRTFDVLIDGRYCKALPTVFTTRLNVEGFRNYVGHYTAQKIFERSYLVELRERRT